MHTCLVKSKLFTRFSTRSSVSRATFQSYLGETQEKFLREQEVSETSKLEEITQLTNQLKDAHVQNNRDQKKIAELEEQVELMQEQGKYLERQLDQYHMKEEDLKSVHDELNSLEEVRYVKEFSVSHQTHKTFRKLVSDFRTRCVGCSK